MKVLMTEGLRRNRRRRRIVYRSHVEILPLVSAVQENNLEKVKYLLSDGVKCDDVQEILRCVRQKEKLCALHKAATKGYLDMMQILLSAGANPNITDHNGDTPLHIAVKLVNTAMVRLLLSSGADPNLVDHMGTAAVHHATSQGHLDLIRTLIEFKTDVHQMDSRGYKPVHIAAVAGHFHIIHLLCSADPSNITARDRAGQCPLHLAAKNGHVETVASLLDLFDADPNERNWEGEVPLHQLVSKSYCKNIMRDMIYYYATFKALIQYGASLDILNKNGRSILEIASINQYAKIADHIRHVKGLSDAKLNTDSNICSNMENSVMRYDSGRPIQGPNKSIDNSAHVCKDMPINHLGNNDSEKLASPVAERESPVSEKHANKQLGLQGHVFSDSVEKNLSFDSQMMAINCSTKAQTFVTERSGNHSSDHFLAAPCFEHKRIFSETSGSMTKSNTPKIIISKDSKQSHGGNRELSGVSQNSGILNPHQNMTHSQALPFPIFKNPSSKYFCKTQIGRNLTSDLELEAMDNDFDVSDDEFLEDFVSNSESSKELPDIDWHKSSIKVDEDEEKMEQHKGYEQLQQPLSVSELIAHFEDDMKCKSSIQNSSQNIQSSSQNFVPEERFRSSSISLPASKCNKEIRTHTKQQIVEKKLLTKSGLSIVRTKSEVTRPDMNRIKPIKIEALTKPSNNKVMKGKNSLNLKVHRLNLDKERKNCENISEFNQSSQKMTDVEVENIAEKPSATDASPIIIQSYSATESSPFEIEVCKTKSHKTRSMNIHQVNRNNLKNESSSVDAVLECESKKPELKKSLTSPEMRFSSVKHIATNNDEFTNGNNCVYEAKTVEKQTKLKKKQTKKSEEEIYSNNNILTNVEKLAVPSPELLNRVKICAQARGRSDDKHEQFSTESDQRPEVLYAIELTRTTNETNRGREELIDLSKSLLNLDDAGSKVMKSRKKIGKQESEFHKTGSKEPIYDGDKMLEPVTGSVARTFLHSKDTGNDEVRGNLCTYESSNASLKKKKRKSLVSEKKEFGNASLNGSHGVTEVEISNSEWPNYDKLSHSWHLEGRTNERSADVFLDLESWNNKSAFDMPQWVEDTKKRNRSEIYSAFGISKETNIDDDLLVDSTMSKSTNAEKGLEWSEGNCIDDRTGEIIMYPKNPNCVGKQMCLSDIDPEWNKWNYREANLESCRTSISAENWLDQVDLWQSSINGSTGNGAFLHMGRDSTNSRSELLIKEDPNQISHLKGDPYKISCLDPTANSYTKETCIDDDFEEMFGVNEHKEKTVFVKPKETDVDEVYYSKDNQMEDELKSEKKTGKNCKKIQIKWKDHTCQCEEPQNDVKHYESDLPSTQIPYSSVKQRPSKKQHSKKTEKTKKRKSFVGLLEADCEASTDLVTILLQSCDSHVRSSKQRKPQKRSKTKDKLNLGNFEDDSEANIDNSCKVPVIRSIPDETSEQTLDSLEFNKPWHKLPDEKWLLDKTIDYGDDDDCLELEPVTMPTDERVDCSDDEEQIRLDEDASEPSFVAESEDEPNDAAVTDERQPSAWSYQSPDISEESQTESDDDSETEDLVVGKSRTLFTIKEHNIETDTEAMNNKADEKLKNRDWCEGYEIGDDWDDLDNSELHTRPLENLKLTVQTLERSRHLYEDTDTDEDEKQMEADTRNNSVTEKAFPLIKTAIASSVTTDTIMEDKFRISKDQQQQNCCTVNSLFIQEPVEGSNEFDRNDGTKKKRKKKTTTLCAKTNIDSMVPESGINHNFISELSFPNASACSTTKRYCEIVSSVGAESLLASGESLEAKLGLLDGTSSTGEELLLSKTIIKDGLNVKPKSVKEVSKSLTNVRSLDSERRTTGMQERKTDVIQDLAGQEVKKNSEEAELKKNMDMKECEPDMNNNSDMEDSEQEKNKDSDVETFEQQINKSSDLEEFEQTIKENSDIEEPEQEKRNKSDEAEQHFPQFDVDSKIQEKCIALANEEDLQEGFGRQDIGRGSRSHQTKGFRRTVRRTNSKTELHFESPPANNAQTDLCLEEVCCEREHGKCCSRSISKLGSRSLTSPLERFDEPCKGFSKNGLEVPRPLEIVESKSQSLVKQEVFGKPPLPTIDGKVFVDDGKKTITTPNIVGNHSNLVRENLTRIPNAGRQKLVNMISETSVDQPKAIDEKVSSDSEGSYIQSKSFDESSRPATKIDSNSCERPHSVGGMSGGLLKTRPISIGGQAIRPEQRRQPVRRFVTFSDGMRHRYLRHQPPEDRLNPLTMKEPQKTLQEVAFESITASFLNEAKLQTRIAQPSDNITINYTKGVYRPQQVAFRGSLNVVPGLNDNGCGS